MTPYDPDCEQVGCLPTVIALVLFSVVIFAVLGWVVWRFI